MIIYVVSVLIWRLNETLLQCKRIFKTLMLGWINTFQEKYDSNFFFFRLTAVIEIFLWLLV